MLDAMIWGWGIGIALVVLIYVSKGVAKNSANSALAVKATVIKIQPGSNGDSQVIFEKENGERVNLAVPNSKCIFVEGEVGMLKEAVNTFGSFTKI
ncbi:MAG: hypothetical protein J6J23_07560 [Clostridia bacterium]|nr:hypothetical protein [Clostridia bacterium]